MTFPLTLRGRLIEKMTAEDLERFSRDNKPYKFEKDPDGTLTVQEPAGYLSSRINSEINRQLANWNFEHKLGEVADSSGGFTLPNHAIKNPDAAWTSNERIQALTKEDQTLFTRGLPGFHYRTEIQNGFNQKTETQNENVDGKWLSTGLAH
jgi:Uma2 family endonuclease